jgi:hypothetical protein
MLINLLDLHPSLSRHEPQLLIVFSTILTNY